MQTANFTIEGMRCGGCVHTIQNALERLGGVKTNSASHEPRAARRLFSSRTTSRAIGLGLFVHLNS